MLQATAALGRLGVAQQRASRAERGAKTVGAEAGEGGHIQLLEQGAVTADHVEVPVRHALGVGDAVVVEQFGAVAAQDLGRRDALEFLLQARADGAAVAGKFHQAERAAGERQPRQTGRDDLALADQAHRQQGAFGFFGQQVGVRERARGNHAHDLALDRALAGGRVADLFADRARFAHLDQLGQVAGRANGRACRTS